MGIVTRVLRVGAALLPIGLLLLLGGVVLNGTVSAFSRSQTEVGGNALLRQGKQVFRFDTFGDQAFWGGALQLHKAIEGAANGGVGPGVSPKTALAVGLKVDAAAIPPEVAAAIKAGKIDLDDPKTTLALLKLNAVVGVKGFFDKDGTLGSMGHHLRALPLERRRLVRSRIGRRLDGWPKIISLSPSLEPFTDLLGVDEATVKKVLLSWGRESSTPS